MLHMIGNTFGYWTVLERAEDHIYPNGNKRKKFLCRCKCGNEKSVLITLLKNGGSKSCGCFQKENPSSLTHGMSNTNIYKTYRGLYSRCNTKSATGYKNYGGRNIKCEWINFEQFYADMGHEYKKGLSLDRIDNNGNYCKENCKWSNRNEQSRNKRNNRLITYKGKTMCLTDWAKYLGVSQSTLSARINTYGWEISKALTF